MPQLHHRDPSIIGLLGASPHLSSPAETTSFLPCNMSENIPLLELNTESQNTSEPEKMEPISPGTSSEAFEADLAVPRRKHTILGGAAKKPQRRPSRPTLHLDKGQVADMPFERPFYGLIVDGIHCHPNSVRVCVPFRKLSFV